MATNKKHIAVYLDKAVEDALSKFCTDNGLKSNKGLMYSAAVNKALAHFFNLESNIPSNTTRSIPSDIPSNTTRSIPSDIPSNTTSNIPSDIPSNTTSNIPSDIPESWKQYVAEIVKNENEALRAEILGESAA
jgi:hypothetical protein